LAAADKTTQNELTQWKAFSMPDSNTRGTMDNHSILLQMALQHTKKRFQVLSSELPSSFHPAHHPKRWRSWGPIGTIGVFYQTKDGKRLSEQFERSGLEPFPGLLTTNAKVPAAIEVSGTLNFFASNRIEGRGFRVQPTASFALWHHAQVFRLKPGKHFVYSIPLALILGVMPAETASRIQDRLDELINHTLQVLRDLEYRF